MSAIVDELVTRLARGEPMEVAERERLKRALGESPRLCETFEVQQSLSDRLRGLSRELRCLRAPDALDALLAKVDFPAPERTAGRSARGTGWAVAATAAAIVVLIGLVDSAGNLASRYGAPTITFAPRATSTHDVDEYFDEFVPLGHGAPGPRATAYSIVRVRLPMSSIDMASNYPASQVAVEANVILGEDGIAQGIRFAYADVIAHSDGVSGGGIGADMVTRRISRLTVVALLGVHPGIANGQNIPDFVPRIAPGGDARRSDSTMRRPDQDGDRRSRIVLPRAGAFELVDVQVSVSNDAVEDAPFSAIATTERIQVLRDDNSITESNRTLIFRDSEGRVRREQTLGTIGPWFPSRDARTIITISDPVEGVSYTIDPIAMQARVLPTVLDGRTGPGGRRPRRTLLSALADFVRSEGANAVRTEDLGMRQISGIEAHGTRTRHTIPAGEIGNDRAIEIESEEWYSPELQITVMSRRMDPRIGETTYHVQEIDRTEPAKSLFAVPDDYEIVEPTDDASSPRLRLSGE